MHRQGAKLFVSRKPQSDSKIAYRNKRNEGEEYLIRRMYREGWVAETATESGKWIRLRKAQVLVQGELAPERQAESLAIYSKTIAGRQSKAGG